MVLIIFRYFNISKNNFKEENYHPKRKCLIENSEEDWRKFYRCPKDKARKTEKK
jgi:hypothetical protein